MFKTLRQTFGGFVGNDGGGNAGRGTCVFQKGLDSLKEIENSIPQWRDIESKPWDQFVLLRVKSGVVSPMWDYVQCVRHSNGCHNEKWTTAQNDRLSDSHTDEPTNWMPVIIFENE